MKTTITFNDLIGEAKDVFLTGEDYKADKGAFADHFLQYATKHMQDGEFYVGKAPKLKDETLRCESEAHARGWLGDMYKAEQALGKQRPSCWRQYKSDILRAYLDYAILPTDFNTYTELKKALNEARKAEKEGTQVDEGAADGAEGAAVSPDTAIMLTLHRLRTLYAQVDEATQAAMIESLQATADEVESLLVAVVPSEPVAAEQVDAA